MKVILTVVLSALFLSCNNTNKVDTKVEKPSETKKETFVSRNNTAHKKADFQAKNILSTDIELYFGGKLKFDATLVYNTKTTQTLIKYKDGRELLFDGENVTLHPASADDKGARFAIFTWSYFLALPYKIDDRGTHLSDFENKELNGKTFNVNKLTFGDNVGDSPDDWYVLYQDKETNLLHAASYIVTLGSSVEEGEKDPHAIVYSDYSKIDDINIAKRWDFFGWNEEKGLTDTLGYANISNIQFLDAEQNTFVPKPDAKKIEL